MEDTIPDPSLWAEYGLPGLMLSALWAFVVWFVCSTRREREETLKAHREEREGAMRVHREERKEWKTDADHREDRVYTVVNELKEIIRSTRNNG